MSTKNKKKPLCKADHSNPRTQIRKGRKTVCAVCKCEVSSLLKVGRNRILSPSVEGAIRAEWHQGCLNQREIAKKFGVAYHHVHRALHPEAREKQNKQDRVKRKPTLLTSQIARLTAEIAALKNAITD